MAPKKQRGRYFEAYWNAPGVLVVVLGSLVLVAVGVLLGVVLASTV